MSGLQAKKIVAPVDFSNESFVSLGTAVDIASSPSDVHAIHVIPELSLSEPGVIWQEIDNSVRKQHAEHELRKKLSDRKYTQVQIEIEVGNPGDCVADFAKRIGADLIVMASHGRTGLAHMLLGSVAERVVRLSHCPVLVLRK